MTATTVDRALSTGPVRMRTRANGFAESQVRTPSGQWVRLLSLNDPAGEARDIVGRAVGERPLPAVVVAIGVGLARIVDELERRRPDVRIIAIELMHGTPEVLRARLRSGQANGGATLVAHAPECRLPVVTWPADVLAAEPLIVTQPIAAHCWPEQVEHAQRAAQQFLYERRANEEARQRLAPMYLEHTLQNLPELLRSPDVSVLDGMAKDDPIVLCGAGPSLDRLLPELRACRPRAWYVALDTALRPLLAAGIVPDLVVSIDPTPLNGRHLLNLPTRERPWLLAEASLDPRAIRAFAGRTIACRIGAADPWPWLESCGMSLTKVRAWGSVLTSACDVLRRMQPARVAFAGIDLAYTNGQPYCRGTAFEDDWEAQRIRDGHASLDDVWRARLSEHQVVESDAAGRHVRTAPHLVAFRNWVRTFVAENQACDYANVSDAGILHGPGIAQRDLDQWLPPRFDALRPADRLSRIAGCAPPAGRGLRNALATVLKEDGPWRTWESRLPRIERRRLEQHLEHAAREVHAREGAAVVSESSAWIDVPFDPSHFFALQPLSWQVDEANVGTYAYKVDGKTMLLSFKINHSTLAGAPSTELFIRLPGNYTAARGSANGVWIGSRPFKETGYVTVHPGHDFVVVHRASEEPFPMEKGEFFLFGQLLLEVQ